MKYMFNIIKKGIYVKIMSGNLVMFNPFYDSAKSELLKFVSKLG